MPKSTRFMLAMGAALVGTLCFVAGQPRYEFLSQSTAKFAGIACFLVSGLFWAAYGIAAGQDQKD